jgi:hypothetical protein
MSDTQTPRTDAAETNWWSEDGLRSAFIVRAEFARELEREIARLTAERDEARREICFLTVFDPEVPHADCSIYEREVATKRGWDCFPQEDGK